MKKKLKKQIEKILQYSSFYSPEKYTKQLLSLFDKTLKELVGKNEKEYWGGMTTDELKGFNIKRQEILDKWEGGK